MGFGQRDGKRERAKSEKGKERKSETRLQMRGKKPGFA